MKKVTYLLLTFLSLSMVSFSLHAQYIDLTTGQKITIVKHQGNGMIYNVQSQRPVYLYVDVASRDTIYGRTGEIVNGRVQANNKGAYSYSGDEPYIYKYGEYRLKKESDIEGYKMKMDNDGDVKVKYGDYKRKKDSDGDRKIKDGETKLKIGTDGTLKHKDSTNNYKRKIDSEGNYLEKDDSLKIKINADGSAKIKDKEKDAKGKIDDDDGDIKIKTREEKKKIKKNKKKTKKEND